MRVGTVSMSVLSVFLLASLAVAVANLDQAAEDEAAATSEIEQLIEDYTSTLQERDRQLQLLHADGRLGTVELLNVQIEMLSAELHVTAEKGKRVLIRRKVLEFSKNLEEIAAAKLEVGQQSTVDFLNIKSRRQLAEIELLRELQ